MAFQARLLDALTDPTLSFRDLAAKLHLPIDQLALILARPDLDLEIRSLESLVAVRTRLVAATILPAAANAARRILDDFSSGTSDCSRDSVLRAVRVLIRLANFAPGPEMPRPVPPRSTRPSTPIRDARTAPWSGSLQTELTQPDASKCEPPALVQDDEVAAVPRSSQLPTDAHAVHQAPCSGDDELPEAEAEANLSPLEAIERAAALIRSGAFTDDQLGEIFRAAAAESGDDFRAAGLEFSDANGLASQLESVATVLRDPAAQFVGAPP